MNRTPLEYVEIKNKFQKALEDETPVLYEINDIKQTYSIVMRITYVGNRWAQGVVTYYRMDGEIDVPYTIHYSDLWTEGPQNASKNVRIIFKGEDPFN